MEKRDDETMAEFEARASKSSRAYKESLKSDPRYRAFEQGVPGKDIDFKTYDMPPKRDSLDEDAERPVEKARKRRFLIEERERITGKKPMLAKGGAVKSSASKRADGIAQRGKTKGRMV
jgi:hypothetical protein